MQATSEQLRTTRHGSLSHTTIARAFSFADLRKYSLKDRLLIRLADISFFVFISLIGRSARYQFEGWEHFEAAVSDGKAPIHAAWHDCILLGIYFWKHRGIACMTSQSFDGEYIARFLHRFGFGAVRGSTTRGGIGAMVEMARLQRAGIPAGFTLDGPKGPARVAKMGAIILAKKSGQPILPFTVTASRRWLAPSWDRLQVPSLFARARLEIAPPIDVPGDADDETLQNKLHELQDAMDALNRRGDEWRKNL